MWLSKKKEKKEENNGFQGLQCCHISPFYGDPSGLEDQTQYLPFIIVITRFGDERELKNSCNAAVHLHLNI